MDGGSAEVAGDFVAGFSKWFAETGGACNLEEYGRWLGETLQTDVSKTSLLSLSCALDCSCGVRSVHPKTVAKYAWIFTQEQRWAEDGGSISVYLPHGAEQSDPKPFRHHFLRGHQRTATLHCMMKYCFATLECPPWLVTLTQTLPIVVQSVAGEKDALVRGVASCLRRQEFTKLSYIELAVLCSSDRGAMTVDEFQTALLKEYPSLNQKVLDLSRFVSVCRRVPIGTLQYVRDFISEHCYDQKLDLIPMYFWRKSNSQFLLQGAKRGTHAQNENWTEKAQYLTIRRICEELLQLRGQQDADEPAPLTFNRIQDVRQNQLRDLSIKFCSSGADREEREMQDVLEKAFIDGQLDAELACGAQLRRWPVMVKLLNQRQAAQRAESKREETAKAIAMAQAARTDAEMASALTASMRVHWLDNQEAVGDILSKARACLKMGKEKFDALIDDFGDSWKYTPSIAKGALPPDWMGKLQVASCVVVVDLGQLLNDETMKPAQLPPVVLATMEALQTSLDSIGVIVLPKTPNMYLLSLIAAAAGRHLDCRLIQTSVPNLYVVVMGKNLDAATPAPQDPPETPEVSTLIHRVVASESWQTGVLTAAPQKDLTFGCVWNEIWSAEWIHALLKSLGVIPLRQNDVVLEVECGPQLHALLQSGEGAWYGLHVKPSPRKEQILQDLRRKYLASFLKEKRQLRAQRSATDDTLEGLEEQLVSRFPGGSDSRPPRVYPAYFEKLVEPLIRDECEIHDSVSMTHKFTLPKETDDASKSYADERMPPVLRMAALCQKSGVVLMASKSIPDTWAIYCTAPVAEGDRIMQLDLDFVTCKQAEQKGVGAWHLNLLRGGRVTHRLAAPLLATKLAAHIRRFSDGEIAAAPVGMCKVNYFPSNAGIHADLIAAHDIQPFEQELAVCMPKQAASACDEKAAEEPHAAVVQQAAEEPLAAVVQQATEEPLAAVVQQEEPSTPEHGFGNGPVAMVPIEAAGMEQSLPDDPETEAAERAQKRQKLSIDEVPSDATAVKKEAIEDTILNLRPLDGAQAFVQDGKVVLEAETTGKKKLKIPSGLVLWATDQGSLEEQSVEAKPFKAFTVPWKLTARTKVYVENFTWATRGGGADGEDKKDAAKDDGEDKKDGDKDECEDKPELDFVSLGDMNKVLNHLEAPRNGKAVWCGEGLDDVKVYGAALDTALQTHFVTRLDPCRDADGNCSGWNLVPVGLAWRMAKQLAIDGRTELPKKIKADE